MHYSIWPRVCGHLTITPMLVEHPFPEMRSDIILKAVAGVLDLSYRTFETGHMLLGLWIVPTPCFALREKECK